MTPQFSNQIDAAELPQNIRWAWHRLSQRIRNAAIISDLIACFEVEEQF